MHHLLRLPSLRGLAFSSLACVPLISLAPPALAQSEAAEARNVESAQAFDIPASSLADALTTFGLQSGLQMSYTSKLVQGISVQAVKGGDVPREALAKLLAGTDLAFRLINGSVVVIVKRGSEAVAADSSPRQLGPVRVEGASSQSVAAGANGSTDPTATEGTGSYTSSALSIASKMPQSIKDTPQSVSVITQQRMRDQNLTDFTSIMNQATGISVIAGDNNSGGSNINPTFYSRGFRITTLQVDGGAPLTAAGQSLPGGLAGGSNYVPIIDMAEYDHVELLRGADGQFVGYGDPAGVINLTRKRPLDHSQVVVEGASGSWSNERAMIDVAGPLALDGRVRGRVVLSYLDQDYFYDIATTNRTLVYGILEGDLTPTTLVSGGVSVTRQNNVPWIGGLPRFQNGDDAKLSHDTCLCFPWNQWNFDTKEAFAQVEQRLGDNWSAKLNLTRTNQQSVEKVGSVAGAINPVTDQGPTIRGSKLGPYPSVQNMADLTLTGSFPLFGHRQQLVFGTSYQTVHGDETGFQYSSGLFPSPLPQANVFNFNPGAYPEPADPRVNYTLAQASQKVMMAYTTLRLTLLEPLHFITGLRYSSYSYASQLNTYRTDAGATGPGRVNRGTDHNLSWPPTYSVVYDVSKTLSAYASYTDIYVSQERMLDEQLNSIDPLTGSNVEAGLKFATPDNRLNATLGAYRIVQKNYPLLVDYGPYAATQGAAPDRFHSCCYTTLSSDKQANESHGADLEVTGELTRGWQLSGGYTFNESVRKGTANYPVGYTGPKTPLISRAPKHLLKLWSSYQFQNGDWWRRLSIGGGVNSQTRSFNAGAACTAYNYGTDANGNVTAICQTGKTVPYQFSQDFYAVFSARIAYQLDRNWNAALNINNVTDKTYYQTAGSSDGGNWYGDPRNFMLTLRGTF